MKKWVALFGFLAIVIALASWFLFFKDGTAANNQSTDVQTATVTKGKIDVKVSGSGTVAVINDQDVTAEDTDTVYKVYVVENQVVAAGEKLISFDNSNPIYAPIAGIVTGITVKVDDHVQDKAVLLHITDYSTLQTTIAVDELDINKIQLDQAATIKVGAVTDVNYEGKVTEIARTGSNEKGVATFNVNITFSNIEKLKPGMSTEAEILTASKADALLVPIEAVQSSNGKKFVMLGNTGTQTEVAIGLTNTNYVEIASGVNEGDIVQYKVAQTSSSTNNNQMMRVNGSGGGGSIMREGNGGPPPSSTGGGK